MKRTSLVLLLGLLLSLGGAAVAAPDNKPGTDQPKERSGPACTIEKTQTDTVSRKETASPGESKVEVERKQTEKTTVRCKDNR